MIHRNVIGLTALLGIGLTDVAGADGVVAPYCGGSDLQTCASVSATYRELTPGVYLVQLISTNLGMSRQLYRMNAPLGVRDVNGKLFGPRSRIHSERNGVTTFSLLRLEKGVRHAGKESVAEAREEPKRARYAKPKRWRW
jgi:hypothetical protein